MADMEKEQAEELAVLCENRERAYRLIARLFEREVDDGFAAHLTDPNAFSIDNERVQAPFEALRERLGDCGEQVLEDLAVDFDRVFFGVGPLMAEKAFPYESVYTSGSGLMMQDAYVDVRHEYREAGWVKNPDFKEPEDHIAIELSFVATCCALAARSLREGDEAAAESCLIVQRSFLDTHLLNWVERFAADVRKANGGFYADAASFMVAYLKADRELLKDVIA